MANATKIRKRAHQLKGQPVRVTLHDGRSYVGWISGFQKEGLILAAPPSRRSKSKKSSYSRPHKANVSGLLPLFGTIFGGAGGGTTSAAGATGAASAGATGLSGLGFFGMMQKVIPVMRMGYNMIKSIRPFWGGLKGLMG